MWWFCWDSERYNELDQQQTTKQWPWPFLGARLALGSALELLLHPATELVSASYHTKSTSHCTSHPDQEMVCCCCVKQKKTTLQNDILKKIFTQLMKTSLVEVLHLSNLFLMLNDCKIVEFFGSFLCRCKRISFNNDSQLLIVDFRWLATMLVIFKALTALQNLLNQNCTVHSLAVSGPNVLMLWVVSTALWPILIK